MTGLIRLVLIAGVSVGMCTLGQNLELRTADAHVVCKRCWRACRTCRVRCTKRVRCKKHYYSAYGRYKSSRGYWTRGRHFHPKGWRANGLGAVPVAAAACAVVPSAHARVGLCAAVGAVAGAKPPNKLRRVADRTLDH